MSKEETQVSLFPKQNIFKKPLTYYIFAQLTIPLFCCFYLLKIPDIATNIFNFNEGISSPYDIVEKKSCLNLEKRNFHEEEKKSEFLTFSSSGANPTKLSFFQFSDFCC